MTTTSPFLLLLSRLSSTPALQQLAPLLVIIVVPLFVFFGRNYLCSIPQFASRMLAVASSALPWNWSSLYQHDSASSDANKKYPIRTRAEQLAASLGGACAQAVCAHVISNTHDYQTLRRVNHSTPDSLISLAHIAS